MSAAGPMRVAILALCLGAAVAAEPAPASGPSALVGAWAAPCDAWGTPAQCRLDWRPGLHPDHLQVDYAITARADGRALFRGQGVYRARPEGLDGYWSDSNGSIHPLSARWQDGVLTTHWGTPDTERGRSEYRLGDAGTLQVTDWVLTPEGWRQFQQVSYRRANAAPTP